MKLKELNIKNFVNFTEMKVKFNGNVTHLIGLSGSGKTTIVLSEVPEEDSLPF